MGQRDRLQHAQAVGYGDQSVRLGECLFGVSPDRPPTADATGHGGRGNPLPEPGFLDARTDRRDHPADGAARHIWRFQLEEFGAPTATQLCVEEHHVGGRDVDDHLTRPGHRFRHLTHREYFRSTEFCCLHGPHDILHRFLLDRFVNEHET